ncbi:MAG: type transporter [Frondihabitans sp.]|nr:type transporter [Frondihabitans sp.]
MSDNVVIGVSASPSTRPSSVIRDTVALIGRSLRLTRRNLDSLFTGLLLPVLLMLLFVYILGGAIQTGTSYVTYVVPGVLLLCAGFVAANTAVTVNHDMTGGVIDRFRSMDINGAAFLASHVTASVIRDILSTAIVFTVALLIGFRADASPLEWLGAAGILLLFIGAISWLGAALGLLTKSPEAAGNVTFVMVFLPYPSSAFVPIKTMPFWIQGFANNQPVTPVIDTVRGLLLHTPLGSSPWYAIAWCVSIMLVSVLFASILFRRRSA